MPLLLGLTPAVAVAQLITGTLLGTLRTESGGRFSGASVTLTSLSFIGGPCDERGALPWYTPMGNWG